MNTIRSYSKFVAVLMLMAMVPACGMSKMMAAKTAITAATRIHAEAEKGFDLYDKHKQEEIIADANATGDVEAARARLVAWFKVRADVLQALAAVWAATTMANTLIPMVEMGLKSQADLDAWISQVFKALAALQASLAKLGVDLPKVF